MRYFTLLFICALLAPSMAGRFWGNNGNSGRDPGTAPVGNVGEYVGPGQLGGSSAGRDPGTAPVGNVGGGGQWGSGGNDPGTAPVGNVGGGQAPVGNAQSGYFGVGNPNIYGQPAHKVIFPDTCTMMGQSCGGCLDSGAAPTGNTEYVGPGQMGGSNAGTAPTGNVGEWVGPGQLGDGVDAGRPPTGNVGEWVGPGQMGGGWGQDQGSAPVGNVGGGWGAPGLPPPDSGCAPTGNA